MSKRTSLPTSLSTEAQYKQRIKLLEAELIQYQKRETEHLAQSEYFRLIMEGVKDYAIYMLDPQGYIVSWTAGAERITGYQNSEVLGKHVSCFYTPTDQQLAKPQEFLEIAKREGRCEREGWRVRKDGSQFWASTIITPVFKAERLVGFTKITRDISKLVELQESLRRTEMMSALGTLVGGVAHEVRNPLFSMTATLDAFEEAFSDHGEYQEYLQVLRNELQRLTNLMQDLLEYGKPASSEVLPNNISEVIQTAVELVMPLAEQTNTKITTSVPTPLPLVFMDKNRLVQVFQNLLDNAIRHSPVNAEVSVTVVSFKEEGSYWLDCTVQDCGPGFQPADLQKIFEPFFSRRHNGTGLGLSIVQRIVGQHGGRVIAGNHPQGGAVMTIRLPAIQK